MPTLLKHTLGDLISDAAWSVGTWGVNYAMSGQNEAAKNAKRSGVKLPEDLTFSNDTKLKYNNGQMQIMEGEYDYARGLINNSGVPYELPEGTEVVATTPDEFMAEFGDRSYNGMARGGQNKILLNTELLLKGQKGYFQCGVNEWKPYLLYESLSHEVGHMYASFKFGQSYHNLGFNVKENYAITFENAVKAPYGRPERLYDLVWPWQHGGWFNKSKWW